MHHVFTLISVFQIMHRWIVAQSVFYHLYNQVSYMSLDEISPLTFSIGNTIKRITVIVSSILIFRTKILPINILGAAIAIFGTFLYSQVPSISTLMIACLIEVASELYTPTSIRLLASTLSCRTTTKVNILMNTNFLVLCR